MTRILRQSIYKWEDLEAIALQAFDASGIFDSFRPAFLNNLFEVIMARNKTLDEKSWEERESFMNRAFKYEQCVFRENYWAGYSIVHQRRTDAKERTLCGRWIEPQSDYAENPSPKVVDLSKYRYRRCKVCRRANAFDVAVSEMMLVETLPKFMRPKTENQAK